MAHARSCRGDDSVYSSMIHAGRETAEDVRSYRQQTLRPVDVCLFHHVHVATSILSAG